MSYKVIGKNEYGTLVIDDEIIQGVSDVCRKCKYLSNCEDEWMKCIINTYYLPDSEAEKLESEILPETITINDLYVTSKQLFDCQDELKASQKELIDLQNENKQLKERVNELENNTTELSENKIAELAQIGSKYLYLGALEEGRISYGGIIEILKRYNEMCK